MSFMENVSSVALDSVLEQIAVQLDGTSSIVKIPTATFNLLSGLGQAIAKTQVSLYLGHEVEFYLDSRCSERVYLASLESIKIYWQCEAKEVPGSLLPVLFTATLPEPKNTKIKTKTANGFMIYRCHNSALIKEEFPGIKNGEISKILGKRWKALTDEEKEPWLKLAKEKSEAKRSQDSASDLDSASPNKRRRSDESEDQGSVENYGASQDTPYIQDLQAGGVTNTPSDYFSQSSVNDTPGTLRQSQVADEQQIPSSGAASSFISSPETVDQSQLSDEQPPHTPQISCSSNILTQSPEFMELEQGQETDEKYPHVDEDGILSGEALSSLMREAGWITSSQDVDFTAGII